MTFQLAKVIGHRGASGYAPENTLASMTKAHELGAEWVEFDVMLASTGEPVIIHDYTLDRTTNGVGEVDKTDFQTLSSLDCGSWFSKNHTGLKIPLLSELLTHVAQLNLGINIEIKPSPGKEQLTAQTAIDFLESHWPKTCKIPLISSFSAEALQAVHQANIDCKLGFIIDEWESDWERVVDQLGCSSLHVDHKVLTAARVEEVKKRGQVLLAYTVNHDARAQELFSWGVDSIFSDYPDLILP
jgi:glycerophosphoryl diester phosphodiesterase